MKLLMLFSMKWISAVYCFCYVFYAFFALVQLIAHTSPAVQQMILFVFLSTTHKVVLIQFHLQMMEILEIESKLIIAKVLLAFIQPLQVLAYQQI